MEIIQAPCGLILDDASFDIVRDEVTNHDVVVCNAVGAPATRDTLGSVIIGEGLDITEEGVLSTKSPMLVGTVNNDTTAFPIERPDGSELFDGDYCIPDSSASYPFEVEGVTFESDKDQAVYLDGAWIGRHGAEYKTAEIELSLPDLESFEDVRENQSEVNQDVVWQLKHAIIEYDDLADVPDDKLYGRVYRQKTDTEERNAGLYWWNDALAADDKWDSLGGCNIKYGEEFPTEPAPKDKDYFVLTADILEDDVITFVKGLYRFDGVDWLLVARTENTRQVNAPTTGTVGYKIVPKIDVDGFNTAYNAYLNHEQNILIKDASAEEYYQVLNAYDDELGNKHITVLFKNEALIDYMYNNISVIVSVKDLDAGIIVDVGDSAYEYENTHLPSIDVEKLKEIYESYKRGIYQLLIWEGSEEGQHVGLQIVSANDNDDMFALDLTIYDRYHCYYAWDGTTTGDVDPYVSTIGWSGMLVGVVTNDDEFPTERPDATPLMDGDYVLVSNESEFPFEIDDCTFESSRDRAIFINKEWKVVSGMKQDTDETPVTNNKVESLSMLAETQAEINAENKEAISKVLYMPELTDVDEWLKGATYTMPQLDEEFARKFIDERSLLSAGACTAIYKDGMLYKNLDWTYDNGMSFGVKILGGTYRVLGTGGCIPELTKDFVASGEWHDAWRAMPFLLNSCQNDQGLFVALNVVPNNETLEGSEVEPTTATNPAGVKTCADMLPSLICLHCKDITEAKAYVESLNIYCPHNGVVDEEMHLMIGDGDELWLLEFIHNSVVWTNMGTKVPWMTNFYQTFAQYNSDGTLANIDHIGEYANGVRRSEIVAAAYDTIETDPFAVLQGQLGYTHTYTDDTWGDEFCGATENLTIHAWYNTPAIFEPAIEWARNEYAHRDRNEPTTWQTVTSSVYDINEKVLQIIPQEGSGRIYEFRLDPPAYEGEHILVNALPTTDIQDDALYLVENPNMAEVDYHEREPNGSSIKAYINNHNWWGGGVKPTYRTDLLVTNDSGHSCANNEVYWVWNLVESGYDLRSAYLPYPLLLDEIVKASWINGNLVTFSDDPLGYDYIVSEKTNEDYGYPIGISFMYPNDYSESDLDRTGTVYIKIKDEHRHRLGQINTVNNSFVFDHVLYECNKNVDYAVMILNNMVDNDYSNRAFEYSYELDDDRVFLAIDGSKYGHYDIDPAVGTFYHLPIWGAVIDENKIQEYAIHKDGVWHVEKQNDFQFLYDKEVTEESMNAVTSNGIYEFVMSHSGDAYTLVIDNGTEPLDAYMGLLSLDRSQFMDLYEHANAGVPTFVKTVYAHPYDPSHSDQKSEDLYAVLGCFYQDHDGDKNYGFSIANFAQHSVRSGDEWRGVDITPEMFSIDYRLHNDSLEAIVRNFDSHGRFYLTRPEDLLGNPTMINEIVDKWHRQGAPCYIEFRDWTYGGQEITTGLVIDARGNPSATTREEATTSIDFIVHQDDDGFGDVYLYRATYSTYIDYMTEPTLEKINLTGASTPFIAYADSLMSGISSEDVLELATKWFNDTPCYVQTPSDPTSPQKHRYNVINVETGDYGLERVEGNFITVSIQDDTNFNPIDESYHVPAIYQYSITFDEVGTLIGLNSFTNLTMLMILDVSTLEDFDAESVRQIVEMESAYGIKVDIRVNDADQMNTGTVLATHTPSDTSNDTWFELHLGNDKRYKVIAHGDDTVEVKEITSGGNIGVGTEFPDSPELNDVFIIYRP